VFVRGGHEFELSFEVIQARARPVISQLFVDIKVAVPRNGRKDDSVLWLRTIGGRLLSEQFVKDDPLVVGS